MGKDLKTLHESVPNDHRYRKRYPNSFIIREAHIQFFVQNKVRK